MARKIIIRITTLALSVVLGYVVVKVVPMLFIGSPNLYLAKPGMMQWHGQAIDVPVGGDLWSWPALGDGYGVVLEGAGSSETSGLQQRLAQGTLVFSSDELLQVLRNNPVQLTKRFTSFAETTADSSHGPEPMFCYCTRLGTVDRTHTPRYYLGLAIGPAFDSVEYLGPRSGIERFLQMTVSALEQSHGTGAWQSQVSGCFAGMRERLREKIQSVSDPTKSKVLSDPSNWCPKFAMASVAAGTETPALWRLP